MKKNILIVSYGLDIGGIERSLIGLLDAIDYHQYSVDLFLFSHDGEFMNMLNKNVNLLPEIKMMSYIKKPIKDVFKNGFFLLGLVRLWAKLHTTITNKLFNKNNLLLSKTYTLSDRFFPDIDTRYELALGFFGPFDYLLNHINAKKKVGWIHTDYSSYKANEKIEFKNWKRLSNIVAVSEECKKAFIKVYPSLEEKVMVIENILDANFVKKQSIHAEVNNEILNNENKLTICTVARFSYAKGLDWAIEAASILNHEGYKIIWYLIGYGPEEKDLKGLINKYKLEDVFIVLGMKVNPYPYIKACDIYVQPSRYEGKAVTVREAQILNKPVLITNFPTAKSQVRDRVDGHICNYSVKGITEGIKIFYNNKNYRDKLVSNTFKFDYGNVNEVEKIYDLLNIDESND